MSGAPMGGLLLQMSKERDAAVIEREKFRHQVDDLIAALEAIDKECCRYGSIRHPEDEPDPLPPDGQTIVEIARGAIEKTRGTQCCKRDTDRDGNCDRHPSKEASFSDKCAIGGCVRDPAPGSAFCRAHIADAGESP